jgi:spore maturation protein SpmA
MMNCAGLMNGMILRSTKNIYGIDGSATPLGLMGVVGRGSPG